MPLPRRGAWWFDHTAYTFLLDRNGRSGTLFPPGTPAERMTFMLREQLESEARFSAQSSRSGMVK